jgi:cysteine desulfurase
VRTYLDHNATSPLRPEVKAAMVAAMDVNGNASSVHLEGRAAHKLMDDAREKLAFKLGCLPQMITFTGGGTEANNMAIRGVAVDRIVVSAIEHPCVLAAAKATGKPIELVPVDDQGRLRLEVLEQMLAGPKALVSVMHANNETGVIQDISAISALTAKSGHLLHVDAVQSFGKLHCNFGLLGADMLTIAAHKVGGPKGVGALIIRDGLVVEPLLFGGGQELRRRAGTENLIAIAGFGVVAELPNVDCGDLTDQLKVGIEGVHIFSNNVARLSNTTCFAMPGLKAETLLMNFDLEGIAVSSGSACSSGKVARSHVLEAMGVDPQISSSAIRVSMGWDSTQANVEKFMSVFKKVINRASSQRAA